MRCLLTFITLLDVLWPETARFSSNNERQHEALLLCYKIHYDMITFQSVERDLLTKHCNNFMLALCLLYSSVFGRFANFQLVFIKRFRLSAQSPPFFPQRAPGLARGGEQGLRGNSLKGAFAVQSLAGIVRRREKGTNERTHCYSRRGRERERESGLLAANPLPGFVVLSSSLPPAPSAACFLRNI